MTEQNQARDLLATLRDALHQLEGTLGRTRDGVDDIASQVARLREGVAALGDLQQREAGLMKISDMETRFALRKGVIFVPVHVPS